MMLIKNLAVVLLVVTMCSCGNNKTAASEQTAANTTADAGNAEDISGIEMFKVSDCATCHKRTETLVGPSFADIAMRYTNASDTTISRLAETIIKGSSGNWKGSIAPMSPHPALPKADAENMVKYILSVKK